MEEEIIKMWKSGLTKYKVAEIYRRNYNMNIKLVRTEMHNRHAGRLISSYESLAIVERVIYKYIMRRQANDKNKM